MVTSFHTPLYVYCIVCIRTRTGYKTQIGKQSWDGKEIEESNVQRTSFMKGEKRGMHIVPTINTMSTRFICILVYYTKYGMRQCGLVEQA